MYADKGAERWLTIYQDDLRKVGITLNLRLVSGETLQQLEGEFNFDFASMGFTLGTFPDPEAMYRSDLADTKNSFNIAGLKDKRVDDLLARYNKEFDQQRRVGLIRELDGILASQYLFVLEWDMPFQRVAYLNKFGHPDSYLSRIGDYQDMPTFWWSDPAQEKRFQQAMADPSVKLDVGATEVRYWQDSAKKGAAFVPPK